MNLEIKLLQCGLECWKFCAFIFIYFLMRHSTAWFRDVSRRLVCLSLSVSYLTSGIKLSGQVDHPNSLSCPVEEMCRVVEQDRAVTLLQQADGSVVLLESGPDNMKASAVFNIVIICR